MNSIFVCRWKGLILSFTFVSLGSLYYPHLFISPAFFSLFHFFSLLRSIQRMHPSSKLHLFSCRSDVFPRLPLLVLHVSVTISWNSPPSNYLKYRFSDQTVSCLIKELSFSRGGIFLVLLLLSSFPAPFSYSPYGLSDILLYPALGPEYSWLV